MIDAVRRRMPNQVLQPGCLGQSWESGFFCDGDSANGHGVKMSVGRWGFWNVRVGESAISLAAMCQHNNLVWRLVGWFLVSVEADA